MIDVFVKVYAPNFLRLCFAMASVERWRMEAEKGKCKLWLLVGSGSLMEPTWEPDHVFEMDRFHIDAKRYAEAKAQSEIYVVADCDQLIVSKDFLKTGLDFLASHPEFGMVAAWMITGEVPDKSGGVGYWEESSIGCPYFVRKGILSDTPETGLASYDTDLTHYVQNKGWKTGFIRNATFNHLGSGYSVVGLHLGGYGWNA